jgi:N-acetylmuramoyl-L-alanine amidase
MKLCNLVEPIPSVLLEPAFIFNDIIMTPEWRPQLVAAIKNGLYKYFAGEEA